MKKFLVWSLAGVLSYFLIAIFASFYFLKDAVVVRPKSGLGNQMFQYAAAYSMAKATNRKLYVIIDRKSAKQGNILVTDRNSGLLQFDIPKEQIVYTDSLFYRALLFPTRSTLGRIPSFRIKHSTFFAIKEHGSNFPMFMSDAFESDIFFRDVEDDIRKIFDIKKITSPKLENTIIKLQKENAVCVHVRRGDMRNKPAFFLDISYQKKAMDLASKLINNPEFYVFSDEPAIAEEELGTSENVHYISDNKTLLPIDDFVLMANCTNNIIANSSFSWWAGYLNKKQKKLVIAPYPFKNDVVLSEKKNDKERYIWKFISYGPHLPKGWVTLAYAQEPLSEKAKKVLPEETYAEIFSDYKPLPFKIYSSDLRQLDLCDGGDFKPGLCYLNNRPLSKLAPVEPVQGDAERRTAVYYSVHEDSSTGSAQQWRTGVEFRERSSDRPTVVTAYYQIAKNKHGHDKYLKWAQNFLSMPFDLVVFTDKKNAEWIRKMRGNLPMKLIEKEFKDLYHYKFFDVYQKMYDTDKEKHHHSPELYIVWAEKVKFVNEAIKHNPYKAHYFVWTDIGVIRDRKYMNESFPTSKYIWNDHMQFGLINDYSNQEIQSGVAYHQEKGVASRKDRVQATVILGDKYAWSVYNSIWDETLKRLMREKDFVGKEQYVMDTIALGYPWLVRLVYIDPRYEGNPWWYPLVYYSN